MSARLLAGILMLGVVIGLGLLSTVRAAERPPAAGPVVTATMR